MKKQAAAKDQPLGAAVFCFLRNRSSAEKGTGAQ